MIADALARAIEAHAVPCEYAPRGCGPSELCSACYRKEDADRELSEAMRATPRVVARVRCRRCKHPPCPHCETWCDQIVPDPDGEPGDTVPCCDTRCDFGPVTPADAREDVIRASDEVTHATLVRRDLERIGGAYPKVYEDQVAARRSLLAALDEYEHAVRAGGA